MQQSSYSSDGPDNATKEDSSCSKLPLEMQEDFDHRYYRPLEVDVSIVMHDIQTHLLKVILSNSKTARALNRNFVFAVLHRKRSSLPGDFDREIRFRDEETLRPN